MALRVPRWFGQKEKAVDPETLLIQKGKGPRDGNPVFGLTDEEMARWVRRRWRRPEQVVEALHNLGYDQTIAAHVPARLMSEEVLWACLGDTRTEQALLENPAFSGRQVAVLLRRAQRDLEEYELREKDFRQPEQHEQLQRHQRLVRVWKFLKGAVLPSLEGEEETLDSVLSTLAVGEKKSAAYQFRRGLAGTLLQSLMVPLSEEQLSRLVVAFGADESIAKQVLIRARTEAPVLALQEAAPPEWWPTWASLAAESVAGLASPEVRRRLLLHGSQPIRLKVLDEEFRLSGPAEYGVCLERLWRENRGFAWQKLFAFPPPAGVEIPRPLAAEMLAQGDGEQRLELMRILSRTGKVESPETSPTLPAPAEETPPRPKRLR